MPAQHPRDPMLIALYDLVDQVKKGDAFLVNVDQSHIFVDTGMMIGGSSIPPIISETVWNFEIRAPIITHSKIAISPSPAPRYLDLSGADREIEDLGTGIEPIVGYRDFDLRDDDDIYRPELMSRNGAPWPAREPLFALCRMNDALQATHDAPEIGCDCGIYAFDSPVHPDLDSRHLVWGEINMWGRVLICNTGYRAEYAYPKTLFVRDTGTKAIRIFRDNLELQYGVPVFLLKEREGLTMGQLMDAAIAALPTMKAFEDNEDS